MKKQYKIFFGIAVAVFVWIGIYFLFQNSQVSQEQDYVNSCNLRYEPLLIEGNSMEPLIQNGSKHQYVRGYYKCWAIPKKEDIVIYNLWMTKNELIKQIRVDSSDRLETKENKLFINGKAMKNSAWETYVFNDAQIKVLELYINENWNIPEDSYLIFWDNITNSIDSRLFWAVHKNDILAKVFIIEEWKE